MSAERLYLTGFMAAGKSAVGRRLAALLRWEFVDLDGEIERTAGATVAEIFARHGEPRFRQLERRALAATGERRRLVVALGGGALLDEEAWRAVRPGGLVVWLKPDFDELAARLEAGGGRPLYEGREAAGRLYRERLPSYERADLVLEPAAGDSVGTTAERVLALVAAEVGEPACAT